MKQMIGPTKLFNSLPIYSGTKDQLLSFITDFIQDSRSFSDDFLKIFTPNPEQMVLADEDPHFYELLSNADILLPDGSGLVWALERQSKSDKNLRRIPGREVFHDLLNLSTKKKWKIFLLGGKEGSAQTIADSYGCAYDPGAKKISEETREENTRVMTALQNTHPDMLFVAYGAPWQEKWVCDNEQALRAAGVKVAMVVGGSFDYVSGKAVPVSHLVESFHLEWLQRLVTEPWRFKRQVKGLLFFWNVMTGKYSK